ncbi:DUF6415 family natural product biosynthesis protein [Streptomyces sp. NPDC059980]|uniref:DUF6415 family natural product biosynthesis protein n=1 Tax=Streptomyces sp. NPDC059980 TaxID=3347022 RepID=UPI0036AF02D3
MTQRTARPPTAEGADPRPVDVETMRASARPLLAQRPEFPEDLAPLAALLRGHLNLMIPEVEAASLGLPKSDIPRACALACVGEARMRLRIGWPHDSMTVQIALVTKLARSVNALCDHWENLAAKRGR